LLRKSADGRGTEMQLNSVAMSGPIFILPSSVPGYVEDIVVESLWVLRVTVDGA
jgi:hypothetical protein